MSLETAARLQDLELMARQISTQISGSGRPNGSPGISPLRSASCGSRNAEEYILALRRGLDEAGNHATRPCRPPSPSSSRDLGPRKADDSTLAPRRGSEEGSLRARTEQLHGERLPSQGDEQTTQMLLQRTRTLLSETRDQLAAAQKRAEEAEEYLSALHQLIRHNLDFSRTNAAALTRR